MQNFMRKVSLKMANKENEITITEPEQPKELPISQNIWLVSAHIACLATCFLINLKVLCAVTMLPGKKRKRSVYVLLANLSGTTIIFAFLGVMFIADEVGFMGLSKPILCSIIAYLKSTITTVINLSIFAIVFKRFQSFQYNLGELLVGRMLALIWISAAVTNIPTLFSVTYDEKVRNEFPNHSKSSANHTQKQVGTCKPVALFDMFGATIFYETANFFWYYVLVLGYMTYAFLELGSLLANLFTAKKFPNELLRRKMESILFIFLHFLTFLVIWLPSGALSMVYRVINRFPTNFPLSVQFPQLIIKYMDFPVYIFLILNPLIYLCICKDLKTKWWECYASHPSSPKLSSPDRNASNTRIQVRDQEQDQQLIVVESENLQTEGIEIQVSSQDPTCSIYLHPIIHETEEKDSITTSSSQTNGFEMQTLDARQVEIYEEITKEYFV